MRLVSFCSTLLKPYGTHEERTRNTLALFHTAQLYLIFFSATLQSATFIHSNLSPGTIRDKNNNSAWITPCASSKLAWKALITIHRRYPAAAVAPGVPEAECSSRPLHCVSIVFGRLLPLAREVYITFVSFEETLRFIFKTSIFEWFPWEEEPVHLRQAPCTSNKTIIDI